ncbi:MAG: NifU family protein [Burkholderiales bacterium]|nr:NifU family protein [Burkholderiales bacterium]
MKLDAPFYTEQELDALYETDPVAAMRISREQHLLRAELARTAPAHAGAALPTRAEIDVVLDEARRILLRDGGDLEYVALAGDVLRVRLKGACAGCPRAALDLRNVVETLVRRRYPRIAKVENVF